MLLNKLPGHVQTAAGWEWTIFKWLPAALVGGLGAIGLVAAVFHWFPSAGSVGQVDKLLSGVNILATAFAILHANIIFTVAIGCIVVMLMKEPAYLAYGFDLVDSDSPGAADSRHY
jgi:hypothetical protein